MKKKKQQFEGWSKVLGGETPCEPFVPVPVGQRQQPGMSWTSGQFNPLLSVSKKPPEFFETSEDDVEKKTQTKTSQTDAPASCIVSI